MSVAIRVTSVVIPLLTSFVAVGATVTVVPSPGPLVLRLPWLALLLTVSVAAMRIAHFATRQLAPLGALYQMSLVFPDEAPSRFRAALRAHTGRHLRRDSAAAPSCEQEAAEDLVAHLARLSSHDRMTRGHSERVRAYAVMLGEEIGLAPAALAKLNWAALAHDLGKLDVPSSILNKPGRPDEDEWRILRGHPAAAAAYTESLRPWLGDWVDCATQHHERFDGTGYPLGLAGADISLSGRIVSIADAFDVMTAARSYKRPLPAEQARAELLRNAGTQFDPQLVRSFLQISLPRPNRVAGWFGWIAQLPGAFPAPAVPVAQTVGNAIAAGAVSAAAVLTAPTDAPVDVAIPAVERAVVAEPTPDLEPPTIGDEPRATTAPTSTVGGSGPPGPSDPDADAEGEPTSPSPGAPPTSQPASGPGAPGGSPPTTTAGPPSSTTSPNSTTTTPTTTTTTPPTTTSTTTTTAPPATTDAHDDAQTIINVLGGTIAVLANDDFGSSSADTATLAIVAPPSRGTATVQGSAIRYVPGFLETGGTDTFTYRICSVAGSCDVATVVVTLAI